MENWEKKTHSQTFAIKTHIHCLLEFSLCSLNVAKVNKFYKLKSRRTTLPANVGWIFCKKRKVKKKKKVLAEFFHLFFCFARSKMLRWLSAGEMSTRAELKFNENLLTSTNCFSIVRNLPGRRRRWNEKQTKLNFKKLSLTELLLDEAKVSWGWRFL